MLIEKNGFDWHIIPRGRRCGLRLLKIQIPVEYKFWNGIVHVRDRNKIYWAFLHCRYYAGGFRCILLLCTTAISWLKKFSLICMWYHETEFSGFQGFLFFWAGVSSDFASKIFFSEKLVGEPVRGHGFWYSTIKIFPRERDVTSPN